MRNVLFIALLTLVAAAADAGCIKCDQSTGYWCYMRSDGTKANCDSPSGAGCITWGVCTSGGSDCEEGCVLYLTRATTPKNDLQLASVTIVLPAAQRAKS